MKLNIENYIMILVFLVHIFVQSLNGIVSSSKRIHQKNDERFTTLITEKHMIQFKITLKLIVTRIDS